MTEPKNTDVWSQSEYPGYQIFMNGSKWGVFKSVESAVAYISRRGDRIEDGATISICKLSTD